MAVDETTGLICVFQKRNPTLVHFWPGRDDKVATYMRECDQSRFRQAFT